MKDEKITDETQSSLEDYFGIEEDPDDQIEEKSIHEKESISPKSSNPTHDSANNDSDSEEENEDQSIDEDEEEEVSDTRVDEHEKPRDLPPSFLLSVDYSGPLNKAIAKLYEPKSKRVYFWEDNTGHKPYLYTDWPTQLVESKTKSNPGFIRTETIELRDLLHDKPVKMTKLVGDNPLAIGGGASSMRNVLVDENNVSHAWEANIRYHLCYTYDTKLVPGLMYKIEDGNLIPCLPNVDKKILQEFKDLFAEEEGMEDIIDTYSPMFFTEAPEIRRLAVDIEVYTPVVNRIPDASTAHQQVTAIGLSDNEGFNKCFVLKRKGYSEGTKSKDFPEELKIVYFALK